MTDDLRVTAFKRSGGNPPIRYDAVGSCLATLGDDSRRLGASVHVPRIGCGLAGGRWEHIRTSDRHAPVRAGIAVTVY
jgi:hypothetical protein